MLPVNIGGLHALCPTSWEDISISQAIELQSIVDSVPDKVKRYFRSLFSESSKNNEDMEEELLKLWRSMLTLLCDIPEDVTGRVAAEDIHWIGSEHLILFAASLLVQPLHNPTGIRSFEIKGQTFLFPKGDKDVMGNDMPLSKTTAIEFCEASDMAVIPDLNIAPVLIAVLCRPAGQKYSEKSVRDRAKLFRALPVSIYYELLSLLSAAHQYMAGEYPQCYGKGNKGKGKRIKTSWCDRLLYVADDKPSELPIVERMPSHEFMRLLNGKIKREKERWQTRI